jgi:hypothetical protein
MREKVIKKVKTPGKRWSNSRQCGEHASHAQAKYAQILLLRQAAGEIAELKYEPVFPLIFKRRYTPDFQYTETATGETFVDEFKGYATGEWRLRHDLFRWLYPHLHVRVIKHEKDAGFLVVDDNGKRCKKPL